MSTLKLDTLSNKAGTASVPSDTIVSGTAKAWVNFNGTGTVAIRRAFNVSSITDQGTGQYQVNFTNAMPDSNYALVGTSNDNAGIISTIGGTYNEVTARVYGSVSLNGAFADWSRITVAIFS